MSTRVTVSVRLSERQVRELLLAVAAVDLTTRDAAGRSAILSAIGLLTKALAQFQERA